MRDLAVGALEETVTVSGEAPVVDVKSSRAQTQFEKETIEALPGAGRLTVLSDIVPGRDADAGVQPRRRRHQRSHADTLQRPRRSRRRSRTSTA